MRWFDMAKKEVTFNALIDGNGVYRGVVADGEPIESGHVRGVEIDQDCDLNPGQYAWDAKLLTFVPLKKEQSAVSFTPDDTTAIAMCFKSLADAGHTFSPDLSAWINAKLSAVDSIANFDKGPQK